MHRVDFLIIGQGLAGSLLAYSLIKQGASVLVIDNNHHGSSTRVAAGLINPITGHRLNITENFFEYATTAKKFYSQIESDLNCRIYHEVSQTRLIKNPGQAEYLKQRRTQEMYADLLDDTENTGGWFDDRAAFPYGAINVSRTAVVDTKILLHHTRAWLEERDSFVTEHVDYQQFKSTATGIEYQGQQQALNASNLVFCEGFQARSNPWLANLPFKVAKGEVLTLQLQNHLERMLSWGKWLVPCADGQAKLGSNYIWNTTSLNANSATAKQFMEELFEYTNLHSDLVRHEVGIRPSTTQRKPFVGPVSTLNNAYCLNGLGSKGCLIAPHYAQLLAAHMLNGQILPHEVTQWL